MSDDKFPTALKIFGGYALAVYGTIGFLEKSWEELTGSQRLMLTSAIKGGMVGLTELTDICTEVDDFLMSKGFEQGGPSNAKD